MIKCEICGAVEVKGKWYAPGKYTGDLSGAEFDIGICPGDDKLAKHEVDGVVTLTGTFIAEHNDEIFNLIDNVCDAKLERNIAARIFEIAKERDKTVIETTDAHLAAAIGNEIKDAFDGELSIRWRDNAPQVRVDWHRDG